MLKNVLVAAHRLCDGRRAPVIGGGDFGDEIRLLAHVAHPSSVNQRALQSPDARATLAGVHVYLSQQVPSASETYVVVERLEHGDGALDQVN
jgi:hypothetical protein